MKVEAGLLGPLRLLVDCRDITPTAARERALLAALVVHCGHTLSSEELIAEVWNADAPGDAEAALQNYVHRLRKRVDSHAGPGQGRELLARASGGYVLRMDPQHSDGHRFVHFLDQARSAMAANQPTQAADLLESALELWRGTPLAGTTPGPLTSAYVMQFEDLHIEALTLWADSHLAQERYAHVVPELRALTHDYPRHDRFKAQLATALQGMGQITEAREVLRHLPEPPGPAPRELTLLTPQPLGSPTTPPDQQPPEPSAETHNDQQTHPASIASTTTQSRQDPLTLHFSVLGPVRARRGDRELPMGSPQQRALLAVLLLRGGHTATAEELIDAIWGEEPPDYAKAGVRTYAARTRKALGPDATVLVSESGGYAVRTGRAGAKVALDLDTAVAHATEAEKALAGGDRPRAREEYAAALEQWSGEPLAHVPGPFAERQRSRLTEWQLSLLEQRIDLDLQLGAHAEAVSELSALTSAHPLRERLRELLMLALYRSGRQAEALAVYADTRRMLADELGVDPCTELTDLHQRILEADPTLNSSVTTKASADNTIPIAHRPAQLPAPVADFTGRSIFVNELRDQLAQADDTVMVISAVAGIGGIGKTTLAVHVAHAVAEHFPDGQLYVDLQGAGPSPAEPAAVLGAFLRSLGVEDTSIPDGEEERSALFRSLLSGRRVLTLLDNARDAAQVRPLLAGTKGCAALVTGRVRMVELSGAHLVDLDVMSPEEAMTLFTRIIGEERVSAERQAAMAVVAACGFLPLAIRIAAARLTGRRTWTVSALASKLENERRRLDELQIGDKTIKATFELGYGQLDAELGRAFRLLSLAEGPDISLHAAAALLDRPAEETEDLLEALVDASLLESTALGRYRFHALVQLFARACAERDEPSSERDAALSRLLDFYLASAAHVYALDRPGERTTKHLAPTTRAGLTFAHQGTAIDWLFAEAENLLACARHMPTSVGALRRAADLLLITTSLAESGTVAQHYEQTAQLLRTTAHDAGDVLAEARVCSALTTFHIVAGRFDAAEETAQQTEVLSKAAGDPLSGGRSLNDRGIIANFQSRFTDGEAFLLQAIEAFRADDNRASEASAMCNLSHIHLSLGRTESAIQLAQQGLEMYERLGHRTRMANARYALGQTLTRAGRSSEGLDELNRAAALFRETRQSLWEGVCHFRMAEAHMTEQQPARAISHAEQALVLRGIGGEWMRGQMLTVLGCALMELGQRDRARACWTEALQIFEEMGASTAEVSDLLDQVEAREAREGSVA